ncbi:adenylate/guanylate cyclase domain-containing protein [Desulfobacterales bacterium HSG2]|nr:adenylate/guanylate cyclase domain-containing protein [Desulfobacterales bacterium HSG2]
MVPLKKMTSYFSRTQEFLASSWDNYKANKQPNKRVKTAFMAILFADIAESTRIYETLGDKSAQNLIAACLFLLSKVTVQLQGKVIKTIGDEVMCTFPTANDAVKAAKAMHQAVDQMPVVDKSGLFPPNIRIGIHSGPVVIKGKAVFGDAVNVASRMVGLAKQRQIITTEQTVNLLKLDYQSMSRCIDRTTNKGETGELNIHELVWEPDATAEFDNSHLSLVLKSRLKLRFCDHIINVDKNRPSVTMGRQPHNDLVVEGTRVSRSHASIEYRRGRFVLIDRSTNGTYLLINGKQGIVKRVETPLYGDGIIGLSQKVTPDSPEAIHFSITP